MRLTKTPPAEKPSEVAAPPSGLFRVLVLLAVCLALGSTSTHAARRYATIGTGGVTGVYYPTGGAISRMANQNREQTNLQVAVISTPGSVYNVNAVVSGDLEFGVIQSDRQYQAVNGTKEWEGRPQTRLRSVFSIHPESVVLVAAEDSGIRNVAALRGKAVNIGNPGSGQRGNAEDLLAAVSLDPLKDLAAEESPAADSAGMLQDGKIDAFFYTVGHPNGSLKEATSGARRVRFIPIPDTVVRDLTKRFPYYTPAAIPTEFYPGLEETGEIPSFGVRATLCTSVDVPAEVVYAVVKGVFDNFGEFKGLHPAYNHLRRETMLQGLSAPLHPGAEQYFREAGLLD